jgi:hypothetical protein
MKSPDRFPDEEKPKTSEPTPEEIEKEEEERYQLFLRDHPEEEMVVPDEVREDCQKYVASLRETLRIVKEKFPVAELNAILTEEQALNNPIRESGKITLELFLGSLDFLRKYTNITADVYNELHAQYVIFSRAVGVINKGLVNHELDLRPPDHPKQTPELY